EVRFRKVCTGIYGTIIHAANFQRQRIAFRRNQQIGAQAAIFLRQTVSDVKHYTERRGCHGHSQCQSCHGQQFAPGASREGVGNETKEHFGWSENDSLSYRGISSVALVSAETSMTTSLLCTWDVNPMGLQPPFCPIEGI